MQVGLLVLESVLLIGGLYVAAAYLRALERLGTMPDKPPGAQAGMSWQLLLRPVREAASLLLHTAGRQNRAGHFGTVLALTAAVLVFAVIPLAARVSETTELPTPLMIAPELHVGILLVPAADAMMILAVLLVHGEAARERITTWAMTGLALGIVFGALAFSSGSLQSQQIVFDQSQTGLWGLFLQPIAWAAFSCAAVARVAAPWGTPKWGRHSCLPEAEPDKNVWPTEALPEGGAGIPACQRLSQTRMSGPAPSQDGLAVVDYLQLLALAYLLAVLFLGGWHFWGMAPALVDQPVSWTAALLRGLVLHVKVLGVVAGLLVLRLTQPWWGEIVSTRRLRQWALVLAGVNFALVAAGQSLFSGKNRLGTSLIGWIAIFAAALAALAWSRRAKGGESA